MAKDSHSLKRYNELSISTNQIKAKYYNPETDKLDIDRLKKDISKLRIDIRALETGEGLYTYDSKTGKYIKLFEDLEIDYIHTLRFRLSALEIFVNQNDIISNIVIPKRIKNYKINNK